MKKLLLGAMLLALAFVFPASTMAQVGVSVGVDLPPLVIASPPEVVVLPETDDVYVAPAVDVDLYFWNGWWWRPWGGGWYRSRYYDRGWGYIGFVPRFYFGVDPGWRGFYRDRMWHGHPWHYERIGYGHLEHNWRRWHHDRHWERKGRHWGLQNYKPKSQKELKHIRDQRRAEYNKNPEVRKHREEMKARKPRPEAMKPKGQVHKQTQAQKPKAQQRKQPQAQKPRAQQHRQPQMHKPGGQQHRQPQGGGHAPKGQPHGGKQEHKRQ